MLIAIPTTQFTECKVHFLISSSHNIRFLLLLLSLHLMFTCCCAYRDYLFIFRLFAYSAFHVVAHTPLARLLTRISSLAASQICAYDERSKKKTFCKNRTVKMSCTNVFIFRPGRGGATHTHIRTHSTRPPYLTILDNYCNCILYGMR